MLISSLPGANSRFPEHKIGIFVLGEVSSGGGGARVVLLGLGYSGRAAQRVLLLPGGVLLGVWRGLFVGCKEGKELFSEGGGVFEEQCVHAGGDGTLYVGWLVVCEEAL